LAGGGHDVVDAPGAGSLLAGFVEVPLPPTHLSALGEDPNPYVGDGGGSTSFPFLKASLGAAGLVVEFLAVGGGAWQCLLCGDDPGLESASSYPVVVAVPCLPVFLLSLRSAACVFSEMMPRVGNGRGEVSSAAAGLGLFYEH
jgi:hypothetical protein